jgi:hypothetical protein
MFQPVITFYLEQEKPYRIFGFVRLIAKKSPEMAKTTQNFSKSHQTLSPVLMKMRVK